MSVAGVPGPALLFCPGDRPDRFAKAAARADAVILDLEDAVAPERKDAARQSVVAAARGGGLDPATTVVRVNAAGTPWFEDDLAAVRAAGLSTVMVAKAESVDALRAVGDLSVVALCESPLGVEDAGLLAAEPNVAALMWGAEDLVAALGGTSSRRADGTYRDYARYARSRVLVAAGARGKAAYDTVHLDIADEAGLADEAADAAASGFAGTACIHPAQVAAVRAAYAPSQERLAWARRVLAAADDAGGGVFALEGQMVDGPVLAQARRAVTAAGG